MNVVPAGVHWDDPAAYADIPGHGRSGLAWEILRRDPAYHLAVAEHPARPGMATVSAFTARWGLHFR